MGRVGTKGTAQRPRPVAQVEGDYQKEGSLHLQSTWTRSTLGAGERAPARQKEEGIREKGYLHG